MDFRFDIFKLGHQRFVNVETTGGVDKDIIIAVVFRIVHGVFGDFNGVNRTHFEHGNVDLFADDLQLFNGGGSVNVARHKQRAVALAFEFAGDFGAVRGFTGALQAAHHHDCGRVRSAREPAARAAHERGQLFVDDFNDHLRGGQAFHYLRADGTLGHFIGKIFRDFIVNVRFEKRQAHFAHGFFYIIFI